MTFSHALSTNNYGPAKLIVATSAANGTHTTLASAMAAATSGDTIFLRDSVTENVTLTPGVNISSDGSSPSTPSITGTLTMTGAGTCTISGIELITNSAPFLTVSGSAASIVYLLNCYLNISNNDGISFSTSSSSARIYVKDCLGDLGTTGIKIFDSSSAGTLFFFNSDITNSGGSATASTISAGTLGIRRSGFSSPITTSGTATFSATFFQCFTDTQNVACLILGGSGDHVILKSLFDTGSAVALTINTVVTINASRIDSSNATAAIDGSGTINYSDLSFETTSHISTTAQVVKREGPSKLFTSSNSGATNTLTLANASNTASSSALQQVTVAGTSAGDPFTTYTVTGGGSASVGIDNTDSDRYKVSYSTALGTTDTIIADATGGQYKGYLTSTAPAAGFLGERLASQRVVGSALGLTTATPADVTSVSLTAGIWDVSGIIGWVTNASTSVTQIQLAISAVSATIGGSFGRDQIANTFPATLGLQQTLTLPAVRVALASTTTYYLVTQATFTVSTMAAYGTITATRVG